MELSDGEKLIAVMLADIMQANKITGEIDPAFVKEAITGGDLWALEWQHPGIFHGEEPSEAVVKETAEILSMCSVLEYSISELRPDDLNKVAPRDRTVFVGFDGNNDDHYGVARMMFQHLGSWPEFHGRNTNSHGPVIEKYRRMMRAYDANGGASRSPLPLGDIQAVLAA